MITSLQNYIKISFRLDTQNVNKKYGFWNIGIAIVLFAELPCSEEPTKAHTIKDHGLGY